MADNVDGPSGTEPIAILPVIMSGGAGTRLWPLSIEAAPKQFHRLTSERTMIQETALRVRGPAFAEPVVVCNRAHVGQAREQLESVGVRPGLIVAEPFGRNTAAVAYIAARLAAELHPGARVLLQPADHRIGDAEAFVAAVAAGASARGRIVTFGIPPTEPHEGYGYIQAGAPIGPALFGVERFVEKPSRAVAEAYLADGGYFWNSGVFLFAPEVMVREVEAHGPEIALAAAAALDAAKLHDGVLELRDDTFAAIPSVSIDVAVMEHTRSAAMVACDVGWADIGSWRELWRQGPLDPHGNRLRGDVVALDTRDSLVWSDGTTIGVVGLDDIVVVAANGAVLVAAKSEAQKVRGLVAELTARRAREDAGTVDG